MTYETIDEKLREEINSFPEDVIGGPHAGNNYVSYIDGYGIAAVATAHIMREVIKVCKEEMTVEELIAKYDIEFTGEVWGVDVSLEGLRQAGIFIAENSQGSYSKGEKTTLFAMDQMNTGFMHPDCKHKTPEYNLAYVICNREWKPNDLSDYSMAIIGIEHAKNLWEKCVENWEMQVNGSYPWSDSVPDDIAESVNKLVDYYSAIVHAD